MPTIPQVAHAMQTVLTETANHAARSTGFIVRQRAFSGAQFVQALVFGFWAQPQATYEDLVETAHTLGVTISAQGLADRLDARAATCLAQVLQAAIAQVVQADPLAIPLFDRFRAVYVQDSTTLALPEALANTWPGCGGTHGSSAALKAQVRWELRRGQIEGPLLQPGRANDKRIGFAVRPPRGAIVVRDLGYFQLDDLAAAAQDDRYWLTRLYPGTAVFTIAGQRHDVLAVVEAQGTDVVDLDVTSGVDHRLACRLLAVRVPDAVAAERRARLVRQAKKKGRVLNAARLAACAWTMMVTNVAAGLRSVAEALVLLRIRWQIELLFKLWKSEGQVDESRRARADAVLCEVYAKLIAMIVQHWVLLRTCGDTLDHSLPKAARAIRRTLHRLVGTLPDVARVIDALRVIQDRLGRVGRQTPRRKHPNAYQLLLDPPPIPAP